MTEEERRRRFGRWQPEALIGGETAKAGLFGKALGLLGLDADGNRAATSWTDAAKHTAGNIINAPQDIGNQLLDLQDYQPVYGTGASSPEDRARAGQQAMSTFGLAGLAPVGGAVAGRGATLPVATNQAGPTWYRGVKDVEKPGPMPAPHGTIDRWWATDNKDLAQSYANSGQRWPSHMHKGATPGVVPSEFRFENPKTIDANGRKYDRIHYNGSVMDTDTLAHMAAKEGHDGLYINNVVDPPMGGLAAGNTSSIATALKRGTVYDPASGDLLWSNPKEGAAPGLLAQAGEQATPFGMTGQSEQNDPYRSALQMQARRKVLGLPH